MTVKRKPHTPPRNIAPERILPNFPAKAGIFYFGSTAPRKLLNYNDIVSHAAVGKKSLEWLLSPIDDTYGENL
jgi:hypothetical protein